MRRPFALAVLIAAVAVTASCSDRTSDGLAIVNDSDTDVTVTVIDGPEIAVGSGRREVVEMDDCLGTAIVVAAEGHPDVTIDGAACAASVLYVRGDHSAYISSTHG